MIPWEWLYEALVWAFGLGWLIAAWLAALVQLFLKLRK